MIVFKGSVKVGSDDSVPYEPFHTLVLSANKNETGVELTATEDNTEFILIAGEPLDQTVFQYGPFVMTSREEIQKTLLDCRFSCLKALRAYENDLLSRSIRQERLREGARLEKRDRWPVRCR